MAVAVTQPRPQACAKLIHQPRRRRPDSHMTDLRAVQSPTVRRSLLAWSLTAGIARTADEMAAPALLITVLAVSDEPRIAALCVAAMTLATGLAGPFVGACLDASRSPRRLTGMAMAWMALAMIAMGPAANESNGVVALLAVLAGLAAPVVSGGWTSQLPTVVPRAYLARATAWDAATYNIAGIVGPGTVGLLGFVVAQSWSISTAGAVMLLAVPLALAVPTHHRALPAEAERAIGTHDAPRFGREVLTGLRLLWCNQALRRVTVMTTVGHMGMGAAFVGITLRAVELGLPASRGGILLGCLAAGALVGTVTMGYTSLGNHPDIVVLLGTLALGCGLIATSMLPNATAIGVVLALAGSAEGLLFTGMLSVRHREAPDRYRGQVFTTAARLKIGANALGMSVIVLLTHDGRALLLSAGALQLLAVVSALALSRNAGQRGGSSSRAADGKAVDS